MTLFIILLVVMVAIFALSITWSILLVKGKNKVTSSDGKMMNLLFLLAIGFALSFVGMYLSVYSLNKITPTTSEILSIVLGGLVFGFSSLMALDTFIIHYWAKYLDKKLDKNLFIILMVCFPVAIVSMLYTTNGFADHISYPVINGISFTEGFVNIKTGSPNIAFYAICILAGALFVYFLCDHKFFLQYGKHGILESTFLVAFPSGIIGARIFYVIGNWSVEFAGQEWWKAFAIWEGGLTILGGALTGIVVGVLWFLWRNKGYNIFLAVDIIVPTILIAQAVGRWGNFFNCEVHGGQVPAAYWSFLPKIIVNNAVYSSAGSNASDGYIYAPLFFVESCSNLLGYFVIAHLFGIRLRKYTQLGDLACGYLIWYGYTRVFMEPLRDTSYNMGSNGYWSWFWAYFFVLFGALLIVINHLVRMLINKKKGDLLPKAKWVKDGIIGTAIISVVSVALLAVGISMMSSSKFEQSIVLNQFNIGLIFLITGVGILFGLGISVPHLVLCLKKQKEGQNA